MHSFGAILACRGMQTTYQFYPDLSIKENREAVPKLMKYHTLSCFYVEKQVPISIDVVLDNVFRDSTNL